MRHARRAVRSDHLEAARPVRRADRAGQHARLLFAMRVIAGELHRASFHGRAPPQDVVDCRAARGSFRSDRRRTAMAAGKSQLRRALTRLLGVLYWLDVFAVAGGLAYVDRYLVVRVDAA